MYSLPEASFASAAYGAAAWVAFDSLNRTKEAQVLQDKQGARLGAADPSCLEPMVHILPSLAAHHMRLWDKTASLASETEENVERQLFRRRQSRVNDNQPVLVHQGKVAALAVALGASRPLGGEGSSGHCRR